MLLWARNTIHNAGVIKSTKNNKNIDNKGPHRNIRLTFLTINGIRINNVVVQRFNETANGGLLMVLALISIADAFVLLPLWPPIKCCVARCVRCCGCCCYYAGYFRSLQVNTIIPSFRWISNVGRWVFVMEFFESFFVISRHKSKNVLQLNSTQFHFLLNVFNVSFTSYWIFCSFVVIINSIPFAIPFGRWGLL